MLLVITFLFLWYLFMSLMHMGLDWTNIQYCRCRVVGCGLHSSRSTFTIPMCLLCYKGGVSISHVNENTSKNISFNTNSRPNETMYFWICSVWDFLIKWLQSLVCAVHHPLLVWDCYQSASAPVVMTTSSEGRTRYHMTTLYLIRIRLFILTLQSGLEVRGIQQSYFIENLAVVCIYCSVKRTCCCLCDKWYGLWQQERRLLLAFGEKDV